MQMRTTKATHQTKTSDARSRRGKTISAVVDDFLVVHEREGHSQKTLVWPSAFLGLLIRFLKAQGGEAIPRWVWRGMDEGFRRVAQVEHWVQMLLGIFATNGVLPLEFKPAYSIGDLLVQRLDALEQEADKKGGVKQVLAIHFAGVFRASFKFLEQAGRSRRERTTRSRQRR